MLIRGNFTSLHMKMPNVSRGELGAFNIASFNLKFFILFYLILIHFHYFRIYITEVDIGYDYLPTISRI
jgi:hypothetical protein